MATLQSLADLGQQAPNTTQPEAPVYTQKLDAQGRAYATGKRPSRIDFAERSLMPPG